MNKSGLQWAYDYDESAIFYASRIGFAHASSADEAQRIGEAAQEAAMSVTYYVALPFMRTEDGVAPGAAQEMPNEAAAIRRAEAMSRDAANAGALAFKRSGDPNMGNFSEATILKSFGEVPTNLDEL
jgi:hypothetical protein